MAESRAQRMQVVLVLAERNEQKAGQQFSQYRTQVEAETEQLRQLDDYAKQYLHSYSERKVAVRPQELIAYSGFIQRLGEACKEQQAKLDRMNNVLAKYQQAWRTAYQKRESLKELIVRLRLEENAQLDKRLQKELDELVGQAYSRQPEEK
jgi:flagellar FliJ protein